MVSLVRQTALQPEMASHDYPHAYRGRENRSKVHWVEVINVVEPKNLGILVGGGPAPGINSVISAATIEARNSGLEVVGIYDGFAHLI